MGLDSTGYRGWTDRVRPTWLAVWPIARTGVVLVLKRKLFWILLGLALVNFLFLFALIYLKAQISIEQPRVARFVDRILTGIAGDGETYLEFMFAQGTVTMLVLAFAGELLVGNDFREGGLTFYLSRRIGRWQYVVGKLLAIAMIVALTTTSPALVLYIEYGLLTDSMAYFRDNLRILLGILGYGAAMAVSVSLLLMALSSWLQRTVPLVMSWACIFVFLPALGGILRHVYDNRYWDLLRLWHNVKLMGHYCFGSVRDRDEKLLIWATLIVVAVAVLSMLAIIPRVRAVRVVQ